MKLSTAHKAGKKPTTATRAGKAKQVGSSGGIIMTCSCMKIERQLCEKLDDMFSHCRRNR